MIIISPAKNQQEHHIQPRTLPSCLEVTGRLAKCMQGMSKEELRRYLKISEQLASLAKERMQNFSIDHINLEHTSPAVYTYRGDVYKHLDVETLSEQSIDYLQQNMIIISAMYGPLKPLDGILCYRLEMVSRLPEFSDLAALWRPCVTSILEKEDIVFNLASNEYSKAVDQQKIKRWVDIVFLDKTSSGYKVIAVKAKRMRGEMLRYMILNKIKDPEQLQGFSHSGYIFDKNGSSKNRIQFKNDTVL
jgi:cytoplasmic iron level regulating protein YaaA (DUF328/UPF0246 family)